MESEITNFDNPIKKLNGLAQIVFQVEMNSQGTKFNLTNVVSVLLALTMLSPNFKDKNHEAHPMV